MQTPEALSPTWRSSTRLAGLAYIITIAAGLFAEAYSRGSILVTNDPARTAAHLQESVGLYRWGVAADCVMIIAYVIVTALLYRLFKPVSASLSLIAALFSMLGLALLAAATAMLMLPLQDASVAYAVLKLHGAAYNLTGIFFGAYCLLIGCLILRSNYLPLAIGWLMALAGAVFVINASLTLLAPALAKMVPDIVMLVSLIGEGSLALYLAAFGARPTS